MSVIAGFSIPAKDFALGHLLEVRPGVQVRLESMVPTGETVIPYFWVKTPDITDVEAALEGSPIVNDAKIVDTVGDEALFRVAWSEDVDGVIETIKTTDCVILGGRGHGDHWTFQLRFPQYDHLSTFYRSVVDKGISMELESVHDPIDQSGPPGVSLTDDQRDALVMALEKGYFAVPRGITLVELAEDLGISDSAVSQRIRRGLTRLLSSGLFQE